MTYTCNNPSRYTSREVILKLMSTLHGKKFLKERFCILILTTHCDCVEGDLETRVEALATVSYAAFEQPNKICLSA